MIDSKYISVRLSHLLLYSSVGAIVRGTEYLMTVKDIRQWRGPDNDVPGRVIPYVEQVKSSLGIEKDLREPPIASVSAKGRVDGAWIPAQRFPAWMICPSCSFLYYRPWKNPDPAPFPMCRHGACEKKGRLEQVFWVLIHEEGHMADLPWHFLAHRQSRAPSQRQCRADFSEEPYLKLARDRHGGVMRLHCLRCKVSAPFDSTGRLHFGSKTWRQPWIPEPPPEKSEDELGAVVEINDVRIHSPEVNSALVIPPESRVKRGSVEDKLYSNSSMRSRIESAKTDFAKKQAVSMIANELDCEKSEIRTAMNKIKDGYPLYGENITRGQLLESEWKALTEKIPDVKEDEDFVTSHKSDGWRALQKEHHNKKSATRKVLDIIDRVIAVNRLKEIMVLHGFRRMSGDLVPPDIVGQSDWLPALELHGEGVFFTLNESALRDWESQDAVQERARLFDLRYQASGHDFNYVTTITSRFLLLHTISHMFIRELEAEAGYPAASLKERIYCSNTGNVRMAGVLVYVAIPDVVGSLGGLEEIAEPKKFLRLITRVFERTKWCSLDPVCSEHEGQGPNLLNRAACHACALVPEPSCAHGNTLLDRSFLKGAAHEGIAPLLRFADPNRNVHIG